MFGCISVHAEQGYLARCCKIPELRYNWMHGRISWPGDKGLFYFILFLIFYLNVLLYPPLVINLIFQASSWSRKHLKMTLMSTNESPEEEHTSLFYQVTNLGIVSFSVVLDFATKHMFR